ncbi:FixH family protein [Kangiella spongicola]|uniref:Nitrogen fixation protein FixH n=1 Tax=Kangiella spongicola TaxID=796379 RepID=A0A318DBD5_9GAMM|nr:FixH family protein [Kangiella spongicola]PXF63419.1 nitrogen fixation protein FixH [Kangiella spongicola]
MSNVKQEKPWYKQFWPWFVIAIPFTSVITGTSLLIIASNTTDSMVVDDYYKDGLAINESLAKKNKAKELGVSATLSFDNQRVTVEISANSEIQDSLFLDFQHATLETKDFTMALKQDASGKYYSELNHDISGKWFINLHPYQKQWEVEKKVTLPSSQEVILGY